MGPVADSLRGRIERAQQQDRAALAPLRSAHDCPGGCGREVPHSKLACSDCWWLLPVEHRKAVTNAGSLIRLGVVGEALRWYRENMADGRLKNQPPEGFTLADKFGGRPR